MNTVLLYEDMNFYNKNVFGSKMLGQGIGLTFDDADSLPASMKCDDSVNASDEAFIFVEFTL